MGRSWTAIAAGVIAASLGGGCFSDPAPSGSGAGTTQGDACPIGSLGCPCIDGDACNDDLTCEASVHVCIDPACTPGTDHCLCADGACLAGLACEAGVCHPAGGTSATGDGGDDDASTAGTAGRTTGAATTAMGDGGTTGPADDSGPSMTTGVDPGCDGLTCPECTECVSKGRGPCNAEASACMDDPPCAQLADCIGNCGPADPSCIDSCCSSPTNDLSMVLWTDWMSCVQANCSSCPDESPCQG
jgi:hypothetical protein